MLVRLAADEFGQGIGVYSVFHRHIPQTRLPASVSLPDFNGLGVGQFRSRDQFPPWLSAFAHLVSLVLGLRAEKQMGRVYARRPVTSVEHVQAVWNRAIRDFIADPVRPKLILVGSSEDAIAVTIASNLPEPAVISTGNHDVLPESLLYRDCIKAILAPNRAESIPSLRDWNHAALNTHRSRQPGATSSRHSLFYCERSLVSNHKNYASGIV